MTDILIRNVPDVDLVHIDEQAGRLGLSRTEYLRRRISQDARRSRIDISFVDFERIAELGSDLLDDDVMRDAWS